MILLLLSSFFGFAIIGGLEVPEQMYGKEHPGNYNAVALLKAHTPEKFRVFCSGSIISQRHVLTARHCVSGKAATDIRVFFGKDDQKIDTKLIRTVSKISEFYPAGAWMDFFPNLDVAVLELDKKIPNSDGKDLSLPHFRPLEVLRDPNFLVPGNPITLVGYGNTSTQPGTIVAGRKLTANIQILDYLFSPQFFSLLLVDSESGQGACHGDSGGPAYVLLEDPTTKKKKWFISGITSGFDLVLTPDSLDETGDEDFPLKANCDQGQAIYGFTGYYANWMNMVAGGLLQYSPFNKSPRFPKYENGLRYKSFAQWCENTDFTHPAWLTVKQLLIFASKKRKPNESDREVFLNCGRAQEILEKFTEVTFTDAEYLGSLHPLQSLPNLKKVQIRNVDLNHFDWRSLEESFVETLVLSETKIKNSQPLELLRFAKALRTLKIQLNPLKEVDGLAALTQIENLSIDRNEIDDYRPIYKLTRLKTLEIDRNPATQINLTSFPMLESFSFTNTPITKLDFQQQSLLVHLDGKNDQSIEFIGLEKNTRLETVILSNAKIDPAFLAKLSSLRRFELNHADLDTLDFLRGKSLLEYLDVSQNNISDLNIFTTEKFPRLKRILISSNQLRDLSPLKTLDPSVVLWMGNNPITKRQTPITPNNCPVDQGPKRLTKFCKKNIEMSEP